MNFRLEEHPVKYFTDGTNLALEPGHTSREIAQLDGSEET